MRTYALSTLLEIRSRDKQRAEQEFMMACGKYDDEQKKLTKIKEELELTKLKRTEMQDVFFRHSKQGPKKYSELLSISFLSARTLNREKYLKKSIEHQEMSVEKARDEKQIAQKTALCAHRELRIVTKHKALWLLEEKKKMERKLDTLNDDQNGARYWQKRRA